MKKVDKKVAVKKAPAKGVAKPKKEKKSADEKFIIDNVAKIKTLINAVHKRAEKIKEPKIGVFIDLLVFNSHTKEALDGCSLGLGASVVDELHYIDSVKGARMLRITDNLIDNLSRDIKKRRGIIK